MKIKNFFLEFANGIYEKRFHFLIACFAILLNWAGHTFLYENSYRFLTFDMVGTFVAAITLGSVWAILVAITTPIVLSNLSSPYFIYLAITNITGAIFWGWLAESGKLKLFNLKAKSDIKNIFFIAVKFILFAGIAVGLLLALPSSIIKNVIFQDAVFKQPYSIYFTELFRNIFNISNNETYGLIINYVAETFIEIPNMLITVLIGSIISLTILKYNTLMLTEDYEKILIKKNISWFKIFVSSVDKTEFILFLILGYIYIYTVKFISNTNLTRIVEQSPTDSIQNFIFTEMITIPLIIIIIILFFKLIIPFKENETIQNISYLRKNFLYGKGFETDILNFIYILFAISVAVFLFYLWTIIHLTGITPIKYYQMTSDIPANINNFLWLIILIVAFILIDKHNNNLTYNISLENELIKKQTVQDLHTSFDKQIQKLQILELNWSRDTIELLRSSRHDLVNQLEKTKTGFNDILSEVYEKVITPYKDDILENQKKTRQHIEDLTAGRLRKIFISEIKESLSELINNYNEKLKPYIQIELKEKITGTNSYCYANRLLFIAINNVIDNSVFALQKLLLNDGFIAQISINLEITNNFLHIKITDNAGGVDELTLPKIYKEQITSSKGNRLGEGTIHSAYFVKILNGKITAENINNGSFKGLQTDIILPVREG